MSIIPEEELKSYGSLNLAPMVDFLFLVVAVFATLAVTRTALFDNDIQLVKVQPAQEEMNAINHSDHYTVSLSINEQGQYKWITEFNEYLIESTRGIQKELQRQQELGLLPKDNSKTLVLLHIDKAAQWEPIAQAIFAVRQAGFEIHPVYDRVD
jgi:biopolymer transport protein ExbD